MGTIVLGPRIGKYDDNGKPRIIVGHNLALANLGMWILWMGWFGFNPGSTLSGMQYGLNASVAVNTNAAAASGAIISVLLSWLSTRKFDLGLTMNGALAGLVAITASCAYISISSSIITGVIAGILMFFAIPFLDRIHVNDPVGALPVHLVNGIWGTLAVGLFHETNGLFFGGGWDQLGVQSLGIISVAGWVVGTTALLFLGIKHTVGFRVSEKEELEGLDLTEHGVRAYSDSQ